jgi:hypothetical protein
MPGAVTGLGQLREPTSSLTHPRATTRPSTSMTATSYSVAQSIPQGRGKVPSSLGTDASSQSPFSTNE